MLETIANYQLFDTIKTVGDKEVNSKLVISGETLPLPSSSPFPPDLYKVLRSTS